MADDDKDKVLCTVWLEDVVRAKVLVALTALAVIIVNLTLRTLMRCLVERVERKDSATAQMIQVARKLTLALCVNTAFLAVFVNTNWSDLLGADLGFIDIGEFDDITQPAWFKAVGAGILLTALANVVNPHALPLVLAPFRRRMREKRIKKARTSQQIRKILRPPRFRIDDRLAATAAACVIVLTVGGVGMPVLYLLGACTFTCMYWCDKYALFRLCATPPRFDERLSEWFLDLLTWAATVHMAVSVFVLGSPYILLSPTQDFADLPPWMRPLFVPPYIISAIAEEFSYGTGILEKQALHDRVLRQAAFPVLVLLVLVLVLRVLRHLLFQIPAFKSMCRIRSRRKVRALTYSAVINAGGRLESYHLCHQSKFGGAFRQNSEDPEEVLDGSNAASWKLPPPVSLEKIRQDRQLQEQMAREFQERLRKQQQQDTNVAPDNNSIKTQIVDSSCCN
ncbi:MAG: hypothetical protein MHM6MM_002899 [Cercozoa sp. M6MM]